MIRHEDLRNAIDSVCKRDPEIGFTLNELITARHIGLPVDYDQNAGDPCFLFENDRVFVRKVSFFTHGSAPIEDRLVMKYGELAEKHAIENASDPIDYFAAAKRIRQAGLDCLVRFEIRRAIELLNDEIHTHSDDRARIDICNRKIRQLEAISDTPSPELPEDDAAIRYSVQIDSSTNAHFMRFPFSFGALRQVAEMNLEFFYVRFVLDLFRAGLADRLYAGITGGRLTGLLLLKEKRNLFSSVLEVKYVATINGVPLDVETVDYPRIRGIGTFLMAGAWLVWKGRYPKAHEIFLDAEAEADRFYTAIGFDYRPPYGFVLRKPKGKLLLFVIAMAMNHAALPQSAQAAVNGCIERQIRYLRRSSPPDDPKRKVAILAISSCIQGRQNRVLGEAVKQLLVRYRRKIPEGDLLLQSLEAVNNAQAREVLFKGGGMLQVVCDPVFEQHLENIFHLESAKRIRTIEAILKKAPFPDRIIRVTPRAATEEELAWVHQPDYIAAVAATAGQPLSSFDLDTQTTPQSYATAKLAVGSIFSLIDAIYKEDRWRCGIACIRPPGHHAETDRAMGFCLFNNPALAAMYLKHKYHARRVLIVDVDVHHGNGTQNIFYDTPDVLYFSIHQFPHYPGTGRLNEIGSGPGEGYTINVPISKGLGDKEYARILHYLLNPVAQAYLPEMILVSLGFDLYATDPLGQMNVSDEGYALIIHMLKKLAGQVCAGRILFILEGGYSISGLRLCAQRVFQELIDMPTLTREKIEQVRQGSPDSLPELKKAIEVHRKYWPIIDPNVA